MIYVDQVHYTTDSHGCRVIEKLKWTESLNELAMNECTKEGLIKYINENPNNTKTKYQNLWSWEVGEDIRVVKGQNGSYLRTDPNGTAADNLGDLIEY